MSAKDILSSKKKLSDKDLEEILAASDFSDISDSEEKNPEEIDADYDSDDSIADRDYVPDPLDEDSYAEELQTIGDGARKEYKVLFPKDRLQKKKN